MIKKKQPKYLFSILCDDVREEQGSKISIMGVYTEDILINVPPPVLMNKLSAIIRLSGGTGEQKVLFSLIGPDGEEILKDSSPMIINPKPKKIGHLIVHIAPFQIGKEGNYAFKIFMDGKLFHSMPFKISVQKPFP